MTSYDKCSATLTKYGIINPLILKITSTVSITVRLVLFAAVNLISSKTVWFLLNFNLSYSALDINVVSEPVSTKAFLPIEFTYTAIVFLIEVFVCSLIVLFTVLTDFCFSFSHNLRPAAHFLCRWPYLRHLKHCWLLAGHDDSSGPCPERPK